MEKSIRKMAEYKWPDDSEQSCIQHNAFVMGGQYVIDALEAIYESETDIVTIVTKIHRELKHLKSIC